MPGAAGSTDSRTPMRKMRDVPFMLQMRSRPRATGPCVPGLQEAGNSFPGRRFAGAIEGRPRFPETACPTAPQRRPQRQPRD